jgi:hypothetical protein
VPDAAFVMAGHEFAKTFGSVGIAGDAGHYLGIAALRGPDGAPQRHDAARTAGRQEFQKARRQADRLHEGRGSVRRQREAGQAQPVDRLHRQAACVQKLAQDRAQPPPGSFVRAAYIGTVTGAQTTTP